MSKIPVTSGKIPTVDDGLHEVTCVGVEDVHLEVPDAFGKTEKVRIHIRLEDAEDQETGEAVILDPLLNRTMGKKATLRAWAVAFGLEPRDGEEFETESLVGRPAQALVQTEPDESDGTRHWPKITNILAAKGTARKPAGGHQNGNSETISDWWTKVREEGLEQDYVRELCRAQFDGRTITQITAAEREELYKKLVGDA